mmetsp:Transcript_10912/g.15150  ORF Transcript_10912/g.15150 Transcript_10912/m.15150 type:complete len:336 (+) Transcript_10912:143-1150(+)
MWGHTIAATCVIFSVLVTLCQIRAQIIWNSNLAMRKHVIRILMMVPIYALQCYLGLIFQSSIFFDTIRECYEAVVIYSFVGLIIGFIGGERHVIYLMQNKPCEFAPHMVPFNTCLGSRVRLGTDFYMFAKLGTLQYVVVKPITSIATLLTEAIGMYGEDNPFQLDKAYIYIVLVNTVSQGFAIYSLLYFYNVMRRELESLDFIPKALVLKAVIFFTYWQAIAFRMAYSLGLFPNALFHLHDMARSEDGMARFVDMVLCIEMAGFAVGQWVAWGKGEEFFNPENKICAPYVSSVLSAANLGDLWEDAKQAVKNGEVKHLIGSQKSEEEDDMDLMEF